MKPCLLLLLLLLTGCAMFYNGKNIGGAEHRPALTRFNGDPGECQKYIYEARLLLGDLKQQMQGHTKWGQMDQTLDNGVKLHAQSNQYGLADIDEIWIDVSALKSGVLPDISIIGLKIYFKQHSNTYNLPERGIAYLIGEPFGTTGGGLYLDRNRFSLHDATRSVAEAYYYYNNVAGKQDGSKYNGFPSHTQATDAWGGPYLYATRQDYGSGQASEFIRMYQAGVHYPENPNWDYWDDYGMAAATPYGLYVAPNADFNSQFPDKYQLTGYIGMAELIMDGKSRTLTTEVPVQIVTEMDAQGIHNTTRVINDSLIIDKPPKAIPGDYIISAINARYLGSGIVVIDENGNEIPYGVPPREIAEPSPNSDTGGYTFVFTMSNGDEKIFPIDISFSFPDGLDPYTFSNTVAAFNPSAGSIKLYSLGRLDNPFYQVRSDGYDNGLTGTWNVVAQEVPDSAKPVKVIDVFADYRKTHNIK